MELAVDTLALLVHQFESVRAVPIHVSVPVRDPSVTEQERDLVGGLRAERDEIPEHIHILNLAKCTIFFLAKSTIKTRTKIIIMLA